MKFRLIFLWIIISEAVAISQVSERPFLIEPRIHSGINLPLYKALDYLVEDNIFTFDLSLGFPAYGDDFWEKLYNYPTTGIGFTLSNLGNNDILGTSWSLYKFISIPFWERETISLNYQASLGAAFMPKPFDINTNHLNRAIGSHFNLYIRMGIDMRINIFPRSELIIEGGFTHFSNGKTKSPNYGVNIGSLSLGFNHLFNDMGRLKVSPEIPEVKKRIEQSMVAGGAMKVYDNLLDIKYLSASIAYNAEYVLSNVSRAGIGADFIYDGSIREALSDADGNPEDDISKQLRLGLHVSYSARYKNTLFGINAGYYLYSKYPVSQRIYNKLILQYMITENLRAGIAVRSHMGKADCLEILMGYSW